MILSGAKLMKVIIEFKNEPMNSMTMKKYQYINVRPPNQYRMIIVTNE